MHKGKAPARRGRPPVSEKGERQSAFTLSAEASRRLAKMKDYERSEHSITIHSHWIEWMINSAWAGHPANPDADAPNDQEIQLIKQLRSIGLSGQTRDFAELDFSKILSESTKITIITPDLAGFFSRFKHLAALRLRLAKGLWTRVFSTCTIDLSGGQPKWAFPEPLIAATMHFFRTLPRNQRLDFLKKDAEIRNSPRHELNAAFRILAIPPTQAESHLALVHADTECVVSYGLDPSFTGRSPAFIYKPRSEKFSVSEAILLTGKDGSLSGTVEGDLDNLHTAFGVVCATLNFSQGTRHVDFIDRFYRLAIASL